MPDRPTFVIVGGGLAGAKAAEALRDENFDGRVVIVGAETEPPYERPPLSKGFLTRDADFADARVHPDGYYADRDIELVDGVRATRLDTAARRVGLESGEPLHYDALLLATGAVPRRPPISGADLAGVHVLRTVGDASRLRDVIERGGPLVIIGAGWIGCEVAASARRRGAEVTLVEAGATPLERVLGPQLGEFFAGVHREEGVRIVTGAAVERIAGAERAERVELAGGKTLDCTAVLLGVGVAPDTALAEQAGLEVADGIVTDEVLRTSAPGVFAAGDVASVHHPRYRRRVRTEHWGNALEQGPAAARSMLGSRQPYTVLPYFFSDQYDLGLEYWGLHEPSDRLDVRVHDGRRLQAVWTDGSGRVSAALHVNDWDAAERLKEEVAGERP